MKKTMLGVALSASLISGIAMADVASDIKAGLGVDKVIANALKDGLSLEAALQQALTAAPQQADAIIAAAVAVNPTNAQAVVNAAVAAGVKPGQAVSAAISGGANSSSVSAPTAGGPPSSISTKTNTVSLPSSPSATGGAGGGGGGGGGGIGASVN